jgi:hypothetical protein
MDSPLSSIWDVADAETRFREIVARAIKDGPQRVRAGGDEVVVVAASDFGRAGKSFAEHLLDFPGFDDADLEEAAGQRSRSAGRDVDF